MYHKEGVDSQPRGRKHQEQGSPLPSSIVAGVLSWQLAQQVATIKALGKAWSWRMETLMTFLTTEINGNTHPGQGPVERI